MGVKDGPDDLGPPLEREKWQTEVALRHRELDLKERELKRSRLTNPLFLAIIAAFIAAAGNAYVSWQNGKASQQAEIVKAESARILEAIKTGDPDKATANLRFLLAAGLLTKRTASRIREYLENQPAGQGPSLPAGASVGEAVGALAGAAAGNPAVIRELLNKLEQQH